MARAAVLLADGFEEIEAITVIDVLRRAGVETTTVGVTGADVAGSHHITVRTDVLLSEAGGQSWDAVILPGGIPGSENLRDEPAVQSLIQEQAESGRIVAAICAAPIALSSAGVVADRTVTSYPKYEGNLECASYSREPVVVDGNVTTSRGPGTALSFALSLTEQLSGKGAADQLRHAMLIDG